MESKYYDKSMIDLIQYIQETYKEAFNIKTDEELPDVLKIELEIKKYFIFFSSEKTKAKNPPAVSRFSTDFWRKRISGDAILRPRIWKIICLICDYENDHLFKRGYFTDNHIGDPSILVLEIVKDKLCEIKNETSNLKTLIDRHGLLDQLTNFLEILETSNKFPQNSNVNKISRMEVFIRVRGELENLMSEIALYLNNTCAYVDMKTVMDNSKELLSLGIECLHYSLRSDELLQESSVQSLRNPSNNRLEQSMKVQLGAIMRELLNTPVFQLLFPDSLQSTDLVNHIPQPIFPLDIVDLDADQRMQSRLLILLKGKESETGIQPKCNDKAVLQSFMLLHGLLEEMGRCIVGCEHAFASAQAGGDMLVYGLINDPVAQITGNSILYVNKTLESFNDYYRALNNVYFEYARLKDLKGVQNWVNNLQKSRSAFRRFKESAEITLDALVKVKSKAQRGIDAEKMHKIASNLKALVDINYSINERRQRDSAPQLGVSGPDIHGFFSRSRPSITSQERVTVIESDQPEDQSKVPLKKASSKLRSTKWFAKEKGSVNLNQLKSDKRFNNDDDDAGQRWASSVFE